MDWASWPSVSTRTAELWLHSLMVKASTRTDPFLHSHFAPHSFSHFSRSTYLMYKACSTPGPHFTTVAFIPCPLSTTPGTSTTKLCARTISDASISISSFSFKSENASCNCWDETGREVLPTPKHFQLRMRRMAQGSPSLRLWTSAQLRNSSNKAQRRGQRDFMLQLRSDVSLRPAVRLA